VKGLSDAKPFPGFRKAVLALVLYFVLILQALCRFFCLRVDLRKLRDKIANYCGIEMCCQKVERSAAETPEERGFVYLLDRVDLIILGLSTCIFVSR
jgi:hypothetical protein